MNQTSHFRVRNSHPPSTTEKSPDHSISFSSIDRPTGFVWTTTLIVVVAVSAYLALAILLCLIYRCARRHGMKSINCCPACLTSCPKCSCFNCGIPPNNESTRCAWLNRPAPSLNSLFDLCCPQKTPTEQWEMCPGWSCGSWKICQNQKKKCDEARCKGCLPSPWPNGRPEFLKNFMEDSCCGYGGGNCRFLCLECKVRAREGQGQTVVGTTGSLPAGVVPNAPYPMYPGMSYGYGNQQLPPGVPPNFMPNQPYYWTTQPPYNGPGATAPQVPAPTLSPFPLPTVSSNVSPVVTYPPSLVPSWIPPRVVPPSIAIGS